MLGTPIIRVPTLLLTKNSRTPQDARNVFQNSFVNVIPGLFRGPAMSKYIDKQEITYSIQCDSTLQNVHHKLQRYSSVSNVAGILRTLIYTMVSYTENACRLI